jgi:hypothetical protein
VASGSGHTATEPLPINSAKVLVLDQNCQRGVPMSRNLTAALSARGGRAQGPGFFRSRSPFTFHKWTRLSMPRATFASYHGEEHHEQTYRMYADRHGACRLASVWFCAEQPTDWNLEVEPSKIGVHSRSGAEEGTTSSWRLGHLSSHITRKGLVRFFPRALVARVTRTEGTVSSA